jgi:hypothetical protein
MMTKGKRRQDLVLAIVFGLLFLAGSSVVLCVKCREHWINTQVTREEALAFGDAMGKLYATGTATQVRALFFDDAILCNRTPEGNREIELDSYMLRFNNGSRPYEHSVESVELFRNGSAKLVLNCRVRQWPRAAYIYRKYITLQKRDGRIGIVSRERDLVESERTTNQQMQAIATKRGSA